MALWLPAFKEQYLNYKVVETFHAAEQEQRAEKFEIGKLGNTLTATNAVSAFDDM